MPEGPEHHNSPETGVAANILKALMDEDRRVPDEYMGLIMKEKQGYDPALDAAFSTYWKFLYDETEQQKAKWVLQEGELEKFQLFFRSHLQGGNLIDLGGGMSTAVRDFARYFHTHTYINVEMPGRGQDLQTYKIYPKQEQDGDLVVIDIDADMLAFVSQLKDGSANFTLNGIDIGVIGDRRYHAALAKEVMRATRPGGIIFGVCSDVLKILNEKKSALRRVELPGYSTSDVYIFEKPE